MSFDAIPKRDPGRIFTMRSNMNKYYIGQGYGLSFSDSQYFCICIKTHNYSKNTRPFHPVWYLFLNDGILIIRGF